MLPPEVHAGNFFKIRAPVVKVKFPSPPDLFVKLVQIYRMLQGADDIFNRIQRHIQ
jgi:hypothetical protein